MYEGRAPKSGAGLAWRPNREPRPKMRGDAFRSLESEVKPAARLKNATFTASQRLPETGEPASGHLRTRRAVRQRTNDSARFECVPAIELAPVVQRGQAKKRTLQG